MKRAISLFTFVLMTVGAFAGVLEVTAPAEGAFVGSSTSIAFRIRSGVQEVTVSAAVVADIGGASTNLQTRVTPDTDGNVSGNITWAPSQSFPEGAYTITVTAVEQGNPGNVYNNEVRHVILDRIAPRLIQFSPLTSSSINGPVTITAVIDEPPANIDEWRVTVNDQDLPNNTGSTVNVSVLWDPSSIDEDGDQTVKITVKDKARNQSVQTITVRLDRAAPTINVTYPRTNQALRPSSIVTILVEIQDASASSVDPLAVVVEIRKLDNTLIKRVSRLRYDNLNSTTARWVGRWMAIAPMGVTQFKLVVRAVDKAGNVGVPQEVMLRFGR